MTLQEAIPNLIHSYFTCSSDLITSYIQTSETGLSLPYTLTLFILSFVIIGSYLVAPFSTKVFEGRNYTLNSSLLLCSCFMPSRYSVNMV